MWISGSELNAIDEPGKNTSIGTPLAIFIRSDALYLVYAKLPPAISTASSYKMASEINNGEGEQTSPPITGLSVSQ